MVLFLLKAIIKIFISLLLFDISALGFLLMTIPDLVCGIIFALSLLFLSWVVYDYDKYEQRKHKRIRNARIHRKQSA